MSSEQLLWGGLAILVVFVLNQVVGRLLAQVFQTGTRGSDHYVARTEHTMCTNHTQRTISSLEARFDTWERANREDHQKLFGKLDELKTLILNNKNGTHP